MISTRNTENALENLLQTVRTSKRSHFYQDLWGTATRFENLPLSSSHMIAHTPLKNRLYTDEKGLVKIVYSAEHTFLIKMGLSHIRSEQFGTICKRPMVLISNRHEAIEKSLWFYEHNILPLVGEANNMPVAVFSAKRYTIDALMTEESLIDQFLPGLKETYDLKNIEVLTLLGRTFDPTRITSLRRYFKTIRYVLSLPETGVLAHSCPEALRGDDLVFHPREGSVLDIGGRLVVTRVELLPTPIIRYQTDILSVEIPPRCSCGKTSFKIA